jgi:hypothetical protein
VPAIRRGRDIIHEQFIQAVILIPICQGEVQRSLDLPAELLRLALSLTTMGITRAAASSKRRSEIWIDIRRLSTTTIVVFQENAPVLRAHAFSSRTQTRVRSKRQLGYWLKRWEPARLAGLITRRRAGSTASGGVQ